MLFRFTSDSQLSKVLLQVFRFNLSWSNNIIIKGLVMEDVRNSKVYSQYNDELAQSL